MTYKTKFLFNLDRIASKCSHLVAELEHDRLVLLDVVVALVQGGVQRVQRGGRRVVERVRGGGGGRRGGGGAQVPQHLCGGRRGQGSDPAGRRPLSRGGCGGHLGDGWDGTGRGGLDHHITLSWTRRLSDWGILPPVTSFRESLPPSHAAEEFTSGSSRNGNKKASRVPREYHCSKNGLFSDLRGRSRGLSFRGQRASAPLAPLCHFQHQTDDSVAKWR